MTTLSDDGASQIETVVVPRSGDLGGFEVRRALPSAQKRTVGPFVFLDHMGPVEFRAGSGIDVRPHPHIGLSTVTYLYEGSMVHRDGAGHTQTILPGEVNWMTAGRGIVHSGARRPKAGRLISGSVACRSGWGCPSSTRNRSRFRPLRAGRAAGGGRRGRARPGGGRRAVRQDFQRQDAVAAVLRGYPDARGLDPGAAGRA